MCVSLLKQQFSTCESCVQSTLHSNVLSADSVYVTLDAADVDSVVAQSHSEQSQVLRYMQRSVVAELSVTLYAESTCEGCWRGARGKESSQ